MEMARSSWPKSPVLHHTHDSRNRPHPSHHPEQTVMKPTVAAAIPTAPTPWRVNADRRPCAPMPPTPQPYPLRSSALRKISAPHLAPHPHPALLALPALLPMSQVPPPGTVCIATTSLMSSVILKTRNLSNLLY
jgi:hypothetical protein